MSKNSRLVYSTESGRIKSEPEVPPPAPAGDGCVRIRRETKGRKGKGVTTLSGIDLPAAGLKALAKQLKQLCGTGGSVKDGVIEIQGDHREALKEALQQRGMTVKLAGAEALDSPALDPALLQDLVTVAMPFGRYQGRLLADLPEPYLVWFANNGFPRGKLGVQLSLIYQIKVNGLEYLLQPLRR